MSYTKVIAALAFCLVGAAIVLAQEAQWNQLNEQVVELYGQGKFAEAIPIGQRSLELAENTFGPTHVNMATALHNFASLYHEQWPPLLLPLRSMPTLGKFQAMSRPVFGRTIRRG